MQDRNRLQELAHKWLNGTLTVPEQEEFDLWFNQFNDEPFEVPAIVAVSEQEHERALFAKIRAEIVSSARSRTFPLWRYVAAAAIILVLGVCIYFYQLSRPAFRAEAEFTQYDNQIVPGKNTATLTLANGKMIQLSDEKTGVVIDASKLTYNDGSRIDISDSLKQQTAVGNPIKTFVNTVATPRGGTYQIILPDGTKVWLNAASVLKFPADFSGLDKRKVFLSGEAYFEVAKLTIKNSRIPFVVETARQEVEVLGTHFNLNAYPEEGAIKTTLVEGAVRVTCTSNHKESNALLKPNQQSILDDVLTVKTIDAENEIAWKNGDFNFDSDDLESIMRKVARWYDVEVSYAHKNIKPLRFGGIVSRSKNISAVLKIMQSTGQVSFKTEGRKILVIQNQ